FSWAIAFLALYAWRLPVTYQHARYLLPAIPPLAVYGFDGLASWAQLNALSAVRRISSRAWVLSLAGVTVAFWIVGARAYAQDVRIVETEMVAAARWLGSNTPPDALIAVHDIGAVGYFSHREILDLAGLVSPEVIPIIRNQDALARLIVDSRADYLVTFPGWYPRLVVGPQFGRIYATGAPYSPAVGGENMTVYRVARGD
ncbi:MAG: hypothetical protein HY260_17930, partial [Chloroflexi bacterium]|nr:hypothetical protein [Chloroflexota bacterium]